MKCIAVQFKLKNGLGGGVIVGESFDTLETITAILTEKYGDNVDSLVVLNNDSN